MASGVDTRLETPATIGRYDVLGYLADGGMAEIFLGADAGRPVVIKRILPHLARQRKFVSMFIDEARIGSLVRHPNVVEIHELGQVGADLFMVMEYLPGESVSGLLRRATLRRRRIPFALGAYIVAEACAGLQAAHELCDETGESYGLVHRDVSPSNLFITYDGDVKVLDFGVATAANRLTTTATGQIKGKFSYMSPEQCLGESIDRTTDIFALGVVLYELTTQHRLFKRSNEMLVLRAITIEPYPPPSRGIAGYPEALERVVLRAVGRERKERHRSALELRADLHAAMRGLPLDRDPRAELAALMTELFAERIAEKRELVQHVRAGTQQHTIPAAEVDETVEVPQVDPIGTEDTLILVPTATIPPPRSRRGLVGIVGFVALLSLLGGAALAWYWRGPGVDGRRIEAAGRSEIAVAVAVRADASIPITAPAAVAADASSTLLVDIESIPGGATVYVDDEQLGKTPYELELDGPRAITLELRHDGYATVRQQVEVVRAQQLLISLPALPRRRTPAKRKTPADPFQRFD